MYDYYYYYFVHTFCVIDFSHFEEMSFVFARWVAALTHQCTMGAVQGAAVIWVVVAGLDHTIDVSQISPFLFHFIHNSVFSFFFLFSFYFPSLFF